MARSPSKKEEGAKRSQDRKASGSGPRPKATSRNNGSFGKPESEPPAGKDRKAASDSKNARKERSGADSAPVRKSKSAAARRETDRDSSREAKKDGAAEASRKAQRKPDSAEARRTRPEPDPALSGPVKLALGGSALAILVALIALFASMSSGPKGSSPDRVVVAPPPPLKPKETSPKPSTQRPDETPSGSGGDTDPESMSPEAPAPEPIETPKDPSEPEPGERPEDRPEDPEIAATPDPVTQPAEPEENPDSPSADSGDESLVRFRPEGDTKTLRCTQVVDGDTLILSDKSKVRLIGINTPERGEPLYPEASGLLRKLVLNKDVTLSFDRERKDQFKRTLAYVFVDGHFINGEQVRQGLAYFYEFKPNTKHSALFLKLQRSSRAAKRGLWGRPIEKASEYISHTKSHRYHKAGCKRLRGSEDLRWKTREEALDTGRSPCPDCKS